MIIDLAEFIKREQPCWRELRRLVDAYENEPTLHLQLGQARRFHYLYERASAGLARIGTFSSDADVRGDLESLVARAYGLVHSLDRPRRRLRPLQWLLRTFPRTFRAHMGSFVLATAITLAGMLFGGVAVLCDPQAKQTLLPFGHLQGNPADRVAEEESGRHDLDGHHVAFASMLMTHNAKVALFTMALGLTFGVGTITMLFYNGVILGAVIVDYVRAGQSVFLAGWLLPHGVVEIPAILLAGQAGLVLAAAMIGRGSRQPFKLRLRRAAPDLVTLVFGVGVLLVWAGCMESFLSQYHAPVLPYWLKISLGCGELVALTALLALAGRSCRNTPAEDDLA